jgi:hypothetical protein
MSPVKFPPHKGSFPAHNSLNDESGHGAPLKKKSPLVTLLILRNEIHFVQFEQAIVKSLRRFLEKIPRPKAVVLYPAY